MKYRPEVDGLRTVAVVPVVWFHLFPLLPGGFLGVDVFFVISGFLITTILLRELSAGTFSLWSFWNRRLRRITPVLFVVTSVTLLASMLGVFPPNLPTVAFDALSAIGSFANYNVWLNYGDYWGSAAETSFFLHAWSLSVEEQFYLIYPILLWLLHRYRISIPWALGLLIVVSLGVCYWLNEFHPSAAFYMLPARAWELGVGGLLAWFKLRDSKPASTISPKRSVLAIFAMVALIYTFINVTGVEGVTPWTVLVVLSTAILIGCTDQPSLIRTLLTLPPIVFIGKLSYSIYLWHWPIRLLALNWARHRQVDHFMLAQCMLLATLACSLVTYYWVEAPARKSPRFRTIFFSLGSITLALIVGMLVWPHRGNTSGFAPMHDYTNYYDITPKPVPRKLNLQGSHQHLDVIAKRPAEFANAYAESGIIGGNKSLAKPSIVVIGDSHGAMWGKVIDEIATEMDRQVSFFTTVGNNPFFDLPIKPRRANKRGFTDDEWLTYQKNLLEKITQWKPDLVILSSRWSVDIEKKAGRVRALIDHFPKQKFLIIHQPAEIDFEGKEPRAYFVSKGIKPPAGNYSGGGSAIRIAEQNAAELAIRIENPRVHYFTCPQEPLTKAETVWKVLDGLDILYVDSDHLSYAGTLQGKASLMRAISSAIVAPRQE